MRKVLAVSLLLPLVGCSKPKQPAPQASTTPPPPAKPVRVEDLPKMPRALFAEKVPVGATPKHVIFTMTEPTKRYTEDGIEVWRYDETTADPATGKPDRFAAVAFRDGRVIAVAFNASPDLPAKALTPKTLGELRKAWEENPVAAKEKYAGDRWLLKGDVQEVSEAGRVSMHIVDVGIVSVWPVKEDAARPKAGQPVEIVAVLDNPTVNLTYLSQAEFKKGRVRK